ncbi:hypothetical protein LUR56_29040 [Streptomyces sp. MT29]|nr:hypothetical protein [Streptomyces sp. MT29]
MKPEAADKEAAEEEGPEGGEPDTAAPGAPRRRALRIPRPRRRKPVVAVAEPVVAAAPAPRGGFAHPLLLLAAVLLIAGVVTGSWIPLAGGSSSRTAPGPSPVRRRSGRPWGCRASSSPGRSSGCGGGWTGGGASPSRTVACAMC